MGRICRYHWFYKCGQFAQWVEPEAVKVNDDCSKTNPGTLLFNDGGFWIPVLDGVNIKKHTIQKDYY